MVFFFYNLRDEFSTPEAQNTNKITIPSKTGFATTYPRINKFPIQREIKITTLTQQTDTLFQKKNSSCCYMFRKNHRMNMVRKKKKTLIWEIGNSSEASNFPGKLKHETARKVLWKNEGCGEWKEKPTNVRLMFCNEDLVFSQLDVDATKSQKYLIN